MEEDKKENESIKEEEKVVIIESADPRDKETEEESKELNMFGQAYLILNTYGLVDIDKLKSLFSQLGLDLKVQVSKFEIEEFKDFFKISFILSNLEDIAYVREKLIELLKYAMNDQENQKRIKELFRNSQLIEHMINIIRSTYKYIEENNVSKEEVLHFFNQRYGGILSESIIYALTEIINTEDKEVILNNYSYIQERLVKEYYTEFLSLEEVDSSSLFFIFPKEEYFDLNNNVFFYEKIKVPGLEKMNFHFEEIYVPATSSHAKIWISSRRKDIVIIPSVRMLSNNFLVLILLLLNKRTSALKFMKFTLEKQHSLLEKEISRIKVDLDAMQATLSSYSVDQIEGAIARVEEFVQLLRENYFVCINPVEETMKELARHSKDLDRKLISEVFSIPQGYGKVTFEPKEWLKEFFMPAKIIKEINAKIRSIKSFNENFMKMYGELQKNLVELIEAKKSQRFERAKEISGLISYNIGCFFRGLFGLGD